MSGYLAPSSPDETGSVKEYSLGQTYRDPRNEGRVFKYAEAGGTALARGKLTVAATIVANHDNLNWQTAPASGDTQVKVTLGATAASVNDYQDGWLTVQDGTGEGRAFAIEGHAAADASGTITIDLKEGVDAAGALSETNVDLTKNLYKDIVISATDQADPVTGVPIVAIAADEYGWVQTWGPCAVWNGEAETTTGEAIAIDAAAAGQIQAQDSAGEYQIGFRGPAAGVDTEYQLVYLRLDQ